VSEPHTKKRPNDRLSYRISPALPG
jgi:hypothetical protein